MLRRKLLALTAACPLILATKPLFAASGAVKKDDKPISGRTFVLVHGAFHGGWCWQQVAEILRAEGNRVFTPTFTGLGERSHLLNGDIDLNTFIQDVTAVIDWEELSDIVLVGHSFGGYVISGVADRMPGRISSMVYLDAPMGSNGTSVLDEAPEDVRKTRLQAAISVRGTRAVAAPSSTNFGVSKPEQVAWVDRRMTPMPLKSYQTPLVLNGPPGGQFPKLFIRCTYPPLPNIEPSADYAKKHGWRYLEIATGHDAMVTQPEEVAKILMSS